MFHLLQNRIYRGKIAHKAAIYPGAHDAIIAAELWGAVQAQLASNRQGQATTPGRHPTANLLTGLLHGDGGESMAATHAVKGGKRYRYHVSRRLLATLLQRVVVHHDRVEVQLSGQALLRLLLGDAPPVVTDGPVGDPMEQDAHPLMLSIPARLRRSGKEMVLLVEEPDAQRVPDSVLIKRLTKAHALRDALAASEAPSLTIFAEREQVSKSYVTRVVRLAYLAPTIVTAILAGRQPIGLSAKRLLQDTRLPLVWRVQQRWFDAF